MLKVPTRTWEQLETWKAVTMTPVAANAMARRGRFEIAARIQLFHHDAGDLVGFG